MRASRPWTFFCVVTPGLEQLAHEEFLEKRAMLGAPEATVSLLAGGLEITLPWEQGRALTHVLKIPTRVTVRLDKVVARDFPKLYQKVSSQPWPQWIAHPTPVFKVSAHQCRLMHTGRIAQTLDEALVESHRKQPLSTRWQKEGIPAETVHVRGVDDEWTFSLDITGSALYKRGLSEVKGEAPLRETLAAALLRFMFNGYHGSPVKLWDPMCGSGTFLLEALGHHVAGSRPQAYQTSQLNLGVAPWKPRATLTGWPFSSLQGGDQDSTLLRKLPTGLGVQWEQHDVLTAPRPPAGEAPLWIISNPPYGERLALTEGVPAFAQRLSHSLSQLRPQRVLLLLPADWPRLQLIGLELHGCLRFSNGGLPVEGRLWRAMGEKPA